MEQILRRTLFNLIPIPLPYSSFTEITFCLLCKPDIGLLFFPLSANMILQLQQWGAGEGLPPKTEGRASWPGPGVLAQPVSSPVAEPSCTPGAGAVSYNTFASSEGLRGTL